MDAHTVNRHLIKQRTMTLTKQLQLLQSVRFLIQGTSRDTSRSIKAYGKRLKRCVRERERGAIKTVTAEQRKRQWERKYLFNIHGYDIIFEAEVNNYSF